MFDIGASYTRIELLSFAGSRQQQSGIIWGSSAPGCVVVTSGGRHAVKAGYADLRLSDGTWEYHGQGTKGDQDPSRFGNKLLVDGQVSVLLFTTREVTTHQARESGSHSKRYVFEGIFGV